MNQEDHYLFFILIEDDLSLSSPSSLKLDKCKDRIQECWAHNHFFCTPKKYAFSSDCLTLEKESLKDDLVAIWESLGYEDWVDPSYVPPS